MKKLLTFLMMSILAIGVGWAAETAYYTLDGNTTGGNNGYASESDITQDNLTWKVTGNTTVSPWRIGGKNLTEVDRTVYSTTAMGSAISKVSLSVGTASNISVNSLKLTVYSDAARTNKIDEVSATFAANSNINFTPNQGTEWTTGAYYMFTFNVSVSGNDNRFVQFKSAVFYKNEASIVDAPTFSPAAGFYDEPQNVTISCGTTGATIYYTTDGNDPTTSSSVYSTAIPVSSDMTIKAMAVKSGMTNSSVATAEYSFPKTHTPTYEESFAGTFGDFYKKEFTGTNIWTTNSGYAKASGYSGGATDSESWLISPYIDLTSAANPELSFSHAGNYFTNATNMQSDVKVMVKKQGDTDWVDELSIDTWPDGASWTFANNTTSLSDYAGEIVQIAFVYTSTTERAGTWEIKNFKVKNVDASAPLYYLAGSFNSWTPQDANFIFVNNEDGTYSLADLELEDNVEFKIIKVQNGNVTWLGGPADGDFYGIHGGHHTDISLNGSKNFKIEVGGINTFTVNDNNSTLTVSRDPYLVMKGSFNNWGEGVKMTNNGSVWEITQSLTNGAEFGFLDEWGVWHGGNGYWIKAEHLGNELDLTSSGNFHLDNTSGIYTLTVNSALTKLVVTAIAIGDVYDIVTSTDELNENDNYIIISRDYGYAMAGQANNNRSATSITLADNGSKAVANAETQVFTLEQGEEGWYFNTGSGYLYAASSSANQLKTHESQDNAEAVISITASTGVASVVFQSSNRNVMQYNNGSTLFACYASASQSPVYLYKKEGGITPTLNAPIIEGETPFLESTTVTITADDGAAIYYTLNGDTPSNESTLYEAPFELNESAIVKAIAVKDDLVSSVASKSFEKIPEIASATAFYNYEGTGEFIFTGNLVAIAQTGNYLYAQDDAKGVLIYGTIDQTYEMGDKIPAGFHAKKGAYHGAPQMTNATGMQDADEQTTIEPIELTLSQITLDNYSRYVVIKNVKYEDGNYVVGNETLTIFDRFSIEFTPEEGKTYDIIGVSGWFDGPQLMPLEYKDAAVIEPVVLDGVAFTADRQWATWYGDADYALPEGVTAYVVTGIQGDAVIVESLDYIPANTGVLLNSETSAESVSAMPYTGEAGTIPTNLLVGSLEAQTVTDGYLLYNNQFILAQNGTSLPGHRCYLPASTNTNGAPVLRIGTPGTVTGVEIINTNGYGDNTYYNLMGQPVTNPTPGIYIRGGKKVIVK